MVAVLVVPRVWDIVVIIERVKEFVCDFNERSWLTSNSLTALFNKSRYLLCKAAVSRCR
jgi:hypothetical protein